MGHLASQSYMNEVLMPVRPAFPVPEPVPVHGLGRQCQNTFLQNQPEQLRTNWPASAPIRNRIVY